MRSKINIEFGKRLKKIRARYGKVQEDFAFDLRLEQSTYSNIEQGKVSISILKFLEISGYLKISPVKLMKIIFTREGNKRLLRNFSEHYVETSSNFLEVLGNTLYNLRTTQQLSIKSLSYRAEIDPRHYSKVEKQGRNVGIDYFVSVADALQVAPDYILKLALQKTTKPRINKPKS